MSFKTRYSAVRNATWIYYLLASVFFVWAVQAYPTPRNPDGSMGLFIWHVCMAGGLAFSAGRYKRNQAAKLAAKHRMG